jgi:hypothetical protein
MSSVYPCMLPSWLPQHVNYFSLHAIGLCKHAASSLYLHKHLFSIQHCLQKRTVWKGLTPMFFFLQLVRRIGSQTWESNSCSPYKELGAPTKESASRLIVRVCFIYILLVFLHSIFPLVIHTKYSLHAACKPTCYPRHAIPGSSDYTECQAFFPATWLSLPAT